MIIFIIVYILMLLALLASGMWVATAMGAVGLVAMLIWMPIQRMDIVAPVAWAFMNTYALGAVPLFILLGSLLMRSGLASRIYMGITPVLDHFPGGLLHSNIVAGAILASATGSSPASVATIGTMAIPETEKRGYDYGISAGSICAGGVLAILIPPSILFIVYGVLVQESIGQLFMAGVFPGLILTALFMLCIGIIVAIRPHLVTRVEQHLPWKVSLLRLVNIWPILVIIIAVLGSIYLGVATPTEAAAVGCIATGILSLAYRRLNWQVVKQATLDTAKLTSMVFFITTASKIMTIPLVYLGVPAFVSEYVLSLGASPLMVLVLFYLLYTVLGMVMDGLAMLILTLPTVYPVMMALGFDSVWFGVVTCLLIELSLLTPPVGLNLFVMHSLNPKHSFGEVAKGAMPFLGAVIIMLIIITAFPQLALWLPGTMFGK